MKDEYESPFNTRYASREMKDLFSPDFKFRTWRRLWIALAESEKELGLPVTDEQLAELRAHAEDINYKDAEAREKLVRHDVMAHIYAYGLQCPGAKGIIHLGATSCFVGDNADLVIISGALRLIRGKLVSLIALLAAFAEKYKDLPCLAFTHCQPAQPTTVGKRAALWLYDLLTDLHELEFRLSGLRLRGAKGTAGTQASFMELFGGDGEKVRLLDRKIAEKMGFEGCFPVTGQTYPRKLDSLVLNVLGGIAQSAHKFANDLRLLQSMKEMEEPFGKNQIGSSAMAYKRNPILCERMSALSRYLISNTLNPAVTACVQWFERTLDDSANRRLSLAEGFLAADAVLELYLHIAGGLVVYPKMIEKHLRDELPFMATENILMAAVKKGGDRQELHERLRRHCMAAAKLIREGGENDLVSRIAADPVFGLTAGEIEAGLRPGDFVGRAPEQVGEFLQSEVRPALEKYRGELGVEAKLRV